MTKSGRRSQVALNFRKHEYTFRGGDTQLSGLRVFTANPRLVAWLKVHGMSEKIWTALKAVAQRDTCASMFIGKRLGRLERRLAVVVARRYKASTRRKAGPVDLMLIPGGGWDCRPPKRR